MRHRIDAQPDGQIAVVIAGAEVRIAGFRVFLLRGEGIRENFRQVPLRKWLVLRAICGRNVHCELVGCKGRKKV